MNQNEQIELINECIDWFNHRYPQLIGTLKPVPIGEQQVKRSFWPWKQGFRIHTKQIRLVFTYHQRVWTYEPYDASTQPLDVRMERSVCELQQVRTDWISCIDDFVAEIKQILTYYQIDHP